MQILAAVFVGCWAAFNDLKPMNRGSFMPSHVVSKHIADFLNRPAQKTQQFYCRINSAEIHQRATIYFAFAGKLSRVNNGDSLFS